MSWLRRPAVCAPCVICVFLVALYFLGSTGDEAQALAGKKANGGLPAAIERIETLEDFVSMLIVELEDQRIAYNGTNFLINARLDDLDARVSALEGGVVQDTIP